MASIIKRNNNFCVVYSYKDADGTPKQKWETFTDLSDAKNRKIGRASVGKECRSRWSPYH